MECLGSSVCFLLSFRNVVALLTPGCAIPARRYTVLTYVGLSHSIMDRHASFRAGSRLTFPTQDIFRRRVAECKSCYFDGCWLGSPILYLIAFLRILFRADVLHHSLCMCSRGLLYHVIFNVLLASRFLRWKAHVCVMSGFACK